MKKRERKSVNSCRKGEGSAGESTLRILARSQRTEKRTKQRYTFELPFRKMVRLSSADL